MLAYFDVSARLNETCCADQMSSGPNWELDLVCVHDQLKPRADEGVLTFRGLHRG